MDRSVPNLPTENERSEIIASNNGAAPQPGFLIKHWQKYIGTFDGLSERKKNGSAEAFMNRFITCAKECQWLNTVAGAALQMQLTGNASLWFQARKFENELNHPEREPSPEEWKEKIIKHYSVTRSRDDIDDIRKALRQEDEEEVIVFLLKGRSDHIQYPQNITPKSVHPGIQRDPRR